MIGASARDGVARAAGPEASSAAAEKSAAALDVNAGTGHEPKEFQGLAHFTEHMLFQGTKKYPSLTDYNDYISDHAGSRRAFTDFMNTNYHFDISNDHF